MLPEIARPGPPVDVEPLTYIAMALIHRPALLFRDEPTSGLDAQSARTIRWPLLFISGILIPLAEVAPWTRGLAYLSPLTYAQDLSNRAVLSAGYLSYWLDLALLAALLIAFLIPAAWLHQRSRVMGR